jgi:predicted DNA-binding protein with PD1-like motif
MSGGFEHDSGYPRSLRTWINHNEVAFVASITVVGMLAFAKLAYAKRWFTDG